MTSIIALIANTILIIVVICMILVLFVDIVTMKLKRCKGVNGFTKGVKKYIKDNKSIIDIIITISIALSALSYIAENLNININ